MENNIVDIVMITDAGYIIPTVVAMTSAVKNKKNDSKYNFFIIVNNVSDFHKNKIKELEKFNGVCINFIDSDIKKYNHLCQHTHVPVSAALKFDLPSLLNIDKVLYLDGDIIVKKDLTTLFKTNVNNYYIAAVRDMGGEISQKFNKNIGVQKYFNSGIMLLNLKKLREGEFFKKFIEVKSAHPEWVCMDQDVLNYVVKDGVLFLHLKYNCMLPLYRHFKYSLNEINDFYQTKYNDEIEIEDDSFIVHFAGEKDFRPWNVINGNYVDIWDCYYRLSPYGQISLNRKLYIPKENDDKKRTFIQKIFSVQNEKLCGKKYKVIYVLGIKFSFEKKIKNK